MKFKTTKKDIYNSFSTIIKVPYCDAQYLIYFQSPIGYNCGVYGWNYDLYAFGGVALVTGYRMDIVGIYPDRKVLKKYEEKARLILNNSELKYEVRKRKVNALLQKLIETCNEG